MNNLKILHIANDYSGSRVYSHLVGELDKLAVEQIVYNPIKDDTFIDKNLISFQNKKSRIIYSKVINNTTDKLFYRRKLRKILLDIEKKVDLSKIDLIHAHTWYSDGGIAFLLSQKYKIPYITAVRSSDLNVFYKYLIHERNFGIKIFDNAHKIVVISPIYADRLLTSDSLNSIIQNKIETISNGVDRFWMENTTPKKKDIKPKLLYVGRFLKRKNINGLIHSVLLLRERGVNIELNLVGGGGDYNKKIVELANAYPDFIKYHGKISDKNILIEHYQSNYIFAMPSKHETFGLVYIEALLQGLPVLYTKGDGIDGYFDNSIGEKVDTLDKYEIANKIEKILNSYDNYSIDQERIKQQYSWEKIATRYIDIYKQIVQCKPNIPIFMNDKKIALLVLSCDKYSDLWLPYAQLFDKFWPNCPFDKYFASNETPFAEFGFKPILMGEDKTWSMGLMNALAILEKQYDYVLITLEDLFIVKTVNNEELLKIVDEFIAVDGNYLRLISSRKSHLKFNKYFGILEKQTPYRQNCVSSLWKIETLKQILDVNENAWEFETKGVVRGYAFDGFYCSNINHFKLLNTVIKGKWVGFELKKVQALLPDIVVSRPVFSVKEDLFKRMHYFLFGMFYKIVPYQMQNRLLKMLKRR